MQIAKNEPRRVKVIDGTLSSDRVFKEIKKILKRTIFPHIKIKSIICFRSFGAKTKAYARIWNFPSIWQKALNLQPHYIIEVIGEHYDRLGSEEKIRTLIHELMHIPLNFSGSLLPHRTRAGRLEKKVDKFYRILENKRA